MISPAVFLLEKSDRQHASLCRLAHIGFFPERKFYRLNLNMKVCPTFPHVPDQFFAVLNMAYGVRIINVVDVKRS